VTENGFDADLASPSGGQIPLDPESLAHDVLSELGTDKRFYESDRIVSTVCHDELKKLGANYSIADNVVIDDERDA
jgi:hypothetical protein